MGTTAKKTRTKATNGEVGAHLTEDIPHEVIQTNALPDVENPEKQIKLELAKFNLPEAAIAKMKAEYGGLVIADANDKDGYKKVKEAWQDTRTKRTGLEKKGLELRNRYKVITTAIGKEEDRLIELLEPLEADLYSKWKAIDDEKERVKKEREEAEQKQLMARVEEVLELGMTLKDGFYSIGETISMDVATLRGLPDEQYEKLKTAIKAKAAELKKIADDLAEKKRKEEDDFKRQQDELKQQQEQLAEQQRQIKAQQEQLKKDREESFKLKQELRVGKFLALGMLQEYDYLKYDNGFKVIRLYVPDIMTWTDESIPAMIDEWKIQMKAIDDEKTAYVQGKIREQESIDNKKAFIGLEMERTGMRFIYTAQEFVWEDSAHAFRVPFNELIPLTEAEITAKANEWVDTIKNAKAETLKHDNEQKAAQEKEQKAAMTDKQKWAGLIFELERIESLVDSFEFKTGVYQTKAATLAKELKNLSKTLK